MDKIFAFGVEIAVWVDNGYEKFTIPAKLSENGKKKHMLIHRWLWMQAYGPIPEGYHIHHKDENKLNNSLDNLEMISVFDHNSLHKKGNKYTYKGGCVFWHKASQKWIAQVYRDGKQKQLGSFSSQHEAWNALFSHDPIWWTEERKITKLLELGNDSFKRLAIKS